MNILNTIQYDRRVLNFVLGATLLIAVAIAPLLATDIPPLLDYHNHLARQYILHRLPESPVLAKFYSAAWPATPYLAFDAIVQALAYWLSVDFAGKVFLALMFLLLGLAPVALNAAVHGRVTPVAPAGLLFLHNDTVTLGFVNYLFGMGFGLLLFAFWVKGRSASLGMRLVLFPVLCTLLFFSHLLGFVIYLLCLGSYELGQHVRRLRLSSSLNWWVLDPAQRINLVSLLLQIIPAMTIFSLLGPSTRTVSSNTYGDIERKFELLAGMFDYLIPPYLWTLDKLVVIALPLLILALLFTRHLRVHPDMLWPLGAMLVLFFAMPMELFSGWGADHRLLPALALLAIGSLGPGRRCNVATARLLGLGLIVLVLVRTGAVTADWYRANDYYAEYLRAFEQIPHGSRVYFAFGHAGGKTFEPYPVYHLPHLILAKRDVYLPYLFASLPGGGFTLRYQPGVEPLQRLSRGPALTDHQSPDWNALLPQYDHYLLVNERYFTVPPPRSQLVQVHAGKTVNLYRRLSSD